MPALRLALNASRFDGIALTHFTWNDLAFSGPRPSMASRNICPPDTEPSSAWIAIIKAGITFKAQNLRAVGQNPLEPARSFKD